MGKKIKKWLCVLLAIALLVPTISLVAGALAPAGASASSSGQAPLKVEIKSNKEKYTLLGKMEFTATITNTSDSTVNNISAEALFGRSITPLKNGSQITATKDSLEPGQSFQMRYYAMVDKHNGLDFLVLPFSFIVAMLNGSALNAGDNGFNDGRAFVEASKTVGLISLFSGRYDASTTVKVYYGENTGGDDGFDFNSWPDEIYEYDPVKDVSYDEEENLTYINNIIILIFDWDTPEQYIREVIQSINGQVVGGIEGLNELHIRIETKTLDELRELRKNLNQLDGVFATYDTIGTTIDDRLSYEPNDPWRFFNIKTNFWDNYYDEEWDEESPDGGNWGLEAIQAPSAWAYNTYFSKMKIGVIDDGFDTTHEDLTLTISTDDKNDNWNIPRDHGTHVAGIIGAAPNNGKGISGIVWNLDLLCYCASETQEISEEDKPTPISETKVYKGIDSLLKNNCKVINMSLGWPDLLSATQVERHGETASKAIEQWLAKGKDFIIVQSAGNGVPLTNSPNTKVGVSALFNGFFSSVTEYNCYSKKIPVREIMDRIIIVANAEKTSNGYQLARSSNGGSQISIAAPGTNIYSTVVSDEQNGRFYGQYKNMSGTSMAAPMVAGVVALVWSVNPNNLLFTGSFVRNIVCNTAGATNTWVADNPDSPTASPNSNGYRMVNAKLAVETAIKLTHHTGTLSGQVNDVDTNEPLRDAVIIIKSADKSKDISTKTKSDGTFNVVLPIGNYTVEVSVETGEDYYESQSLNTTITLLPPTTNLFVKLKKAKNLGILTGTVYEMGTTQRLSGVLVEVQLYRQDNILQSALTDENGKYEFELTKDRAYDLHFSKDGYNGKWVDNFMLLGDVSSITTHLEVLPFENGDGSPENPYRISSPQQLDSVRKNLNASYMLTNDIDLASWGDWEPIGNSSNPYMGIFSGNRHVIKNMTVTKGTTGSNNYYAGLFGYISDSQIKDLGLVNCKVVNSVNSGTNTRGVLGGGIAGHVLSSTITNCYVIGNITTSSTIGAVGAGGIASVISLSSVSNCYYVGNVSAQITRVPHHALVGGIVGDARSSSIINCYAIGNLSANSLTDNYVGGIVGSASAPFNSAISTLTNCYYVGNIVAGKTVGGILGSLGNPNSASNCYYPDSISSGIGAKGGFTVVSDILPLTESQLRQQSTYANWDFTNVWAIDPVINYGYPYLRDMQP
ncbi:MAG: S8 family serine peptidase [Oscillospiraceae bacterium]|nr:S8 family serine peptidase [Oscillospiraceae bacterium]